MARQYITTAIDYPNSAPHMGHVLEKVLADVAARWFRLRGDDVRFQIGTDEHGVKIQNTAVKAGLSPQTLVDRHVPLFSKLYEQMCISYDCFIRTSDRASHWPTVIELWKRLQKNGMLRKKAYSGLYCSGCERFMTKRDLVDGICPNHQKAPESVTEENWFFLLSKDADNLRNLLINEWDHEEYRIIPEFRAQETLSLIEQGLEDVSFSRPKSSLSWGIPVPGDEEQTMYVWCDALTNYISGLGYFTDHEEREWWDDATVTHVIGKDIARFHALYWPAMLKHAGVRTPDRLLIHGFLTMSGEKMSKSVGNVVDPVYVIERFGVDPLRFYLSHEIPVGRDGDFSRDRMQKLYDAKLRNDIGNLLNRVIVLLKKDGGSLIIPESPALLSDSWKRYGDAMSSFAFSDALQIACALATDANIFIDRQKPWTKSGDEKSAIMGTLAETIRHIALMFLPFMPETAQKMTKQLGVPYGDCMMEKSFVLAQLNEWGGAQNWITVKEPEILFPVLDTK